MAKSPIRMRLQNKNGQTIALQRLIPPDAIHQMDWRSVSRRVPNRKVNCSRRLRLENHRRNIGRRRGLRVLLGRFSSLGLWNRLVSVEQLFALAIGRMSGLNGAAAMAAGVVGRQAAGGRLNGPAAATTALVVRRDANTFEASALC